MTRRWDKALAIAWSLLFVLNGVLAGYNAARDRFDQATFNAVFFCLASWNLHRLIDRHAS